MDMTTVKVWMRFPSAAEAMASAGRLGRKLGTGRFAVVRDEMGIPGFIMPFAVISHPSLIS